MDECYKGVPWESSQKDSMLFPSLPLSWMPESLGRTAKWEDTIAVLPQMLTSLCWEGQRPNTQQCWRCCWLQCPCLWLLMSLSHFLCMADVSQGSPVFGKRRNDETIWYHLLVWKMTQRNDVTCARPQASKEQMLKHSHLPIGPLLHLLCEWPFVMLEAGGLYPGLH